jgi:putative nucleotidyltransferase with HDIG domain
MALTMPPVRSSSKRFLPHALAATLLVMVLPALAVSLIDTSSRPWLVVATVALAMALSVAAASAGAAIWKRRPGSKDIVFGDLMLWGWLRRVRAERRLDQAQELLGPGGSELSRERRSEVLRQLGGVLEARDAYTHGHSRRVTRHAERVAREMDLPPAEVAKVRTAAAVHDVGKLHTPRAVLTKPDRLTDDEYEIVKQHPVDGAAMVDEMGDPDITAMVLHHHERLDGTGYPVGLAGADIPLGSRIIAVADTFDAITSGRPYRAARRHKQALDVLSAEAGTQLDPVAVDAFLRYYSGKRSVAWSALFIDAPPRLMSWFGGLFQGAGAGAAPLGQAIAAVGAAAVIGTSVGGATGAAAESESATAGRAVTAARAEHASEHRVPATHRTETGSGTPRHKRAAVRSVPTKRVTAKRRRKSGGRGNTKPVYAPPVKAKAPGSPKAGHGNPSHGNGDAPHKDKPPKPNPPESKPPKIKPPKIKPPKLNPPKINLPTPPKPPKPLKAPKPPTTSKEQK